MKQNSRKSAFVKHLLTGPRGVRGQPAQAALAAGYRDGPGLANQVYLLKKDAWIQEHIAQSLARLDLTKERVLQELARIAFSDIADVIEIDASQGLRLRDGVNLDALGPDVTAAIAEIKEIPVPGGLPGQVALHIKLHDKKPALQLLAKFLALIRPPEINLMIYQVMQNLNLQGLTTPELETLQALILKATQQPASALPRHALEGTQTRNR